MLEALSGWYLWLSEWKCMCHTQIQFTFIVWHLFTHLKHLKVFGKGNRSETDEPAEIWPRTVVLHFDWCFYNFIFQIKTTVNKSLPKVVAFKGSKCQRCVAVAPECLAFLLAANSYTPSLPSSQLSSVFLPGNSMPGFHQAETTAASPRNISESIDS